MSKLHLALILIAIALLIIFIPKEKKQNSSEFDPNIVKSAWESCSKNYPCYREKIKPILNSVGLTKIMNAIDQIYGSTCHDQAHITGEVAGEIVSDPAKALQSCTEQCGYGCFHGVLLGAFKVRGNNLLRNLSSLCKTYSDKSFPGQGLTACRHGLGHGLAELSDFNLSKATSYCDLLEDGRAKEECATGVLMEVIETSIIDPKNQRIPIPDNISEVCKDLSGLYLEICQINIGSYEYKRSADLKKSFSLCKSIPTNLQDNCAGDMGTDLYFMLRDPGKIWQACEMSDPDQIPLCVRGAAFSALVTDPSGETSLNLCKKISDDLKQNCFKYVQDAISQIQKEK